jgi:hypothetical protein
MLKMYDRFTHLYQSTPAALASTQPSVLFRMAFIVTQRKVLNLYIPLNGFYQTK